MSGRPGISQKRFSQNKFHLLPDDMTPDNMANPNDATIDIPLSTVPGRSQTGARRFNSNTYEPPTDNDNADATSEKAGLFGRRPGPGRRRKTDTGTSLQQDEEEDTLNRMGRIYEAILNFSVVTRYFIYVSPLALVIAIPIIVGATVAPDARIGDVKIVWFFTWIEVVWLSLWVSKLVAHFLPFLFQFLVGIVSSGTRKYALILRSLEIPLSLVGWSLVSLATFIPIMTQNPDKLRAHDISIKPWESTVKQILFALFICSLILLAEKTLVQLISVSYHRKQYETRIKESKHNIYLLGQLYEASRSLFPEYCKEFREEDTIISDSILGVAAKKARHSRRGSAAPLRLIQNVGQNAVRFGDKITAAFGNVAQEITGKEVFNPTSAHSVVIHALEKKRSTEALARRIWMSFVVEGKDALYEDDIKEVLGAGREAEAEECFHILDRDGNGDISMEEMILTVSEFGRVRKSIARSMHDVDHAIHVLDSLLLTVASIIMILVFVSFVTTGAATVIAAGATSLVSLSFVFATTAQEVLGSCVFLFVKHPFDVGDRVEITGKELFVEEISLLYTVFRTVADQRITQVPNVVLNTNWIDNVTRSKAMRERVTLTVDFGTSFADIQLLKAEMEKFVRDKENFRDFQPDVDIEVIGMGNMDKLELRIEIRHKSNWSNESVRAARRSKFMCALVLAVRKIPIYGPGGGKPSLGDPSNPSYSVTITDELAQEYRKKAEEEREAKRLVPTSELQEVTSTMQPLTEGHSSSVDAGATSSSGEVQRRGTSKGMSETGFIDALHNRPAGFDTTRAEESEQLYRAPSTASASGVNVLGVPRQSSDNDRTSLLLRGPSTGRRKEGRAVAPPSPSAVERTSSLRQSIERYEIPSYYSPAGETAAAATSSPYELSNPYSRPSTATTTQQGAGPGVYQPAASYQQQQQQQQPPTRRPVPGGNQQQQQPSSQ